MERNTNTGNSTIAITKRTTTLRAKWKQQEPDRNRKRLAAAVQDDENIDSKGSISNIVHQ